MKKCLKIQFVFLFLLICSLGIMSCKKNNGVGTIEFDSTYPLALAPDVTWALITDPYASFREEMDWHTENSGHIRRGEILQVLGKSVDDEKTVWYKFEQGWLPASCLSVYSNRMKAQTAADQLKD